MNSKYCINIVGDLCSGCGACAQICPNKAIIMTFNREGFLYPVIQFNCIKCGICLKHCPVIQKKPLIDELPTIVYAVQNQDAAVRNESSSGGAFTLLAEQIIKQGGVVFGAAMTEDCRFTQHIMINESNELSKLRGSKYVQSDTNDTFSQVKQFLDIGRTVLYSGTPCQIAGLKFFLGSKYDCLYTQDLICHGSPSPMVWKRYLEEHEQVTGSKVKRVSFRNKTYGWKYYSLSMISYDNSHYISKLTDDLFLKGFLANLYLRPSCAKCTFKGVFRSSDFTLADFWGGQTIVPAMDDDTGISLVVVHTLKGEKLLKEVNCDCQLVALEDAFKGNPSIYTSVKHHPSRKYFFAKLNKGLSVNTCIRKSLSRVTARKILAFSLKKAKSLIFKKDL